MKNNDISSLVIGGVAIAIIIIMMISSVVITGESNDVDKNILDGHLEAINMQLDELSGVVMEYNESYYSGYFDETSTYDGNG